MIYAEVIFPFPLPGALTYLIPSRFRSSVKPGCRALAPLGLKKIHIGIIQKTHNKITGNYKVKELLDVMEEEPITSKRQLQFLNWIAAYYMCTLGEVMNAALPSMLKLSSQSYIGFHPMASPDEASLDERTRVLWQSLKESDLSIQEVSKLLGLKHPQQFINNLAHQGLIELYEKVKDRYRPKKVKKVQLKSSLTDRKSLELLFKDLEKKPKQTDVLLAYLRDVPVLENQITNKQGMLKSTLLASNISPSSFDTLLKKGVFEEWEEIVARVESCAPSLSKKINLSAAQNRCKQGIEKAFGSHSTILLHGITGSGKTEICMELIREQLILRRQVLYLLPEIALTTQIIARLRRAFGNSFGVYHSRYSDYERAEVWKKVCNKEYLFVIGVRSAIFLPFNQLGLIIIDEEHEPSYKQYEPTPCYHARDAAIYLATLHKANVLLSSATPSLETFQNTIDGKYALITLNERFGAATYPELIFANLLKERKQGKLKGHFSSVLFNAITASLKHKEQVILFQNQRGYASYIICDHCAHIPQCPNCAVSLTYHQLNHKLVCHYCGFYQYMLTHCNHCGGQELRNIGFGTEELEEELNILFPNAIIQRMDLDTTRNKHGYQRIIEEFENGHIDILVGTQMVSKGLDFDKVNLVGVFDADRMIHFPNFRSHERAYQLITQVSGRAGRKSQKGKVIIQTHNPEQPLLQQIRTHDYQAFFRMEILERSRFVYPPYVRLIHITFKHREKKISLEASTYYHQMIKKHVGTHRITGPTEPLIGKIKNQYLYQITLKIEKCGINIPAIKSFLLSNKKTMHQHPVFKSVRVVFDVDPV